MVRLMAASELPFDHDRRQHDGHQDADAVAIGGVEFGEARRHRRQDLEAEEARLDAWARSCRRPLSGDRRGDGERLDGE
jgi:hypothetical protein